jgi:hypothetical protein
MCSFRKFFFDRRSVRVGGLLNKAHSPIEDFVALFLRTVHSPISTATALAKAVAQAKVLLPQLSICAKFPEIMCSFRKFSPTKTAFFAVNVKLHTVWIQVLGSFFSNISKSVTQKQNTSSNLQTTTAKLNLTKTVFTQKMFVSGLWSQIATT